MRTKKVLRFSILISLLTTVVVLTSVLTSPAGTQVRSFGQDRPRISTIISKENRSGPSLYGQQDLQDDVVRVDTNLVTIPATVMDRGGRYITNLHQEDFQIFEDGVEQSVAFFAPVEKPFTILFLLDTSASMNYQLAELNYAANAFVNQLRPDDQLIAIEFSDRVRVLCNATSLRELRDRKEIKLHPQGGNTLLYDAVDDALKRMKKVRGRKAIVLFSDGYGEGLFTTAKHNLHEAEELDAMIYTVQFDSILSRENNFKRVAEANNYMRDLAQKTGGRHYWVERISNLSETFGQVADELSRQYSLGYYPKTKPEPGQPRQVKVSVPRQPDLVVRARDSYIVDKKVSQVKSQSALSR